MPTLADIWRHLESALDDTPALSAEITRLTAELRDTRLDRANLLAAARATLGASLEGESDPLSYLRDELTVPGTKRSGHDQPAADASAGSPDTAQRHATHGGHQQRRPPAGNHRRATAAVGLALPLRTRAPLPHRAHRGR